MKNDIPKGRLIQYIMASAACFPASKFQTIDNNKFIDGGYSDNIPVALAQNSGAEKIIAVNLDAVGIIKKKNFNDINDLILIEPRWDLGNFLVFDKENSERIITLGYLNTKKVMGFYEGNLYTFKQGEYDGKKMRGSDEAGEFFQVDPLVVYTKKEFDSALKMKVDEHIQKNQREMNKAFTLMVADSLKEHMDETNIFLKKAALKVLRTQITAANYLIKNNIY